MIDKLVDTLVGAGPLGILCAVLLVMLAAALKIIADLFKMYAAVQETRITQGLEAQAVTRDQIAIIAGLRDLLVRR